MKSVLVLLSTYNGEKYLKEQIDSILGQERVNVYILIRDDGSIDNTYKILDDYSNRYHNIDVVKGNNVGFVKSFSELIKLASVYREHVDYYAFSDQDDVWYPQKLMVAINNLSTRSNDIPTLFTSNSRLLYSGGKTTELFHSVAPRITKGNALIFGTEQGCSMVFNKKALEMYHSYQPQISYHDRWMYFICFYLGAISYEQEPLFDYRIHDNNTLAKKRSLMEKVFFYLSKTKSSNHVETAKEFYSIFKNQLSEEDKYLFDIYINYRSSLKFKFYLLTNPIFFPPYPYKHFVRKVVFNKL